MLVVKKCDICKKEVDNDNPDSDIESLHNYTSIKFDIESRNPAYRTSYASRGAIIACQSCMKKYVYSMSLDEIIQRSIDRVKEE